MSSVRNTTLFAKNTEIFRGSVVSIRLFDGSIVERVVWAVVDAIVYVCSYRCYEWLLAGSHAPDPIGFSFSEIVDVRGIYAAQG